MSQNIEILNVCFYSCSQLLSDDSYHLVYQSFNIFNNNNNTIYFFKIASGCLCRSSPSEWPWKGPLQASLLKLSLESQPFGTWMTHWMYEPHPHTCTHILSSLLCHCGFSDCKHTDKVTHCGPPVNNSTGSHALQLQEPEHTYYICAKEHTQAVSSCFTGLNEKADVILSWIG